MEVFGNHIARGTIEATVIRADGTVEELGVISSYKRPWWRTLLNKFTPTTKHTT